MNLVIINRLKPSTLSSTVLKAIISKIKILVVNLIYFITTTLL